jgi:hypothetical protein
VRLLAPVPVPVPVPVLPVVPVPEPVLPVVPVPVPVLPLVVLVLPVVPVASVADAVGAVEVEAVESALLFELPLLPQAVSPRARAAVAVMVAAACRARMVSPR